MAKANRRDLLNHSAARTSAALLGTLPVALGLGLLLARLLPVSMPLRYAIGNYSVFPLWVALASGVFLAPSGRSAWLALCAAGLVLGAAVHAPGLTQPAAPSQATLEAP